GHLAYVIEKVVEQDLRGRHGKEGKQKRGASGAEHVPEIRGRSHQDVLDGVGEDPAAFHHSVSQDVEVLLEEHDVGRVLGNVGGRVNRDPDVGIVQRHRI